MPESQGLPEMLTADVAGHQVFAAIQTIIARGEQATARAIRAETGLGENQVQKALRLLKLGGYIALVGERRKAHWRLVVDVDGVAVTHCPPAYCAPVQGAEPVAPLPVPECIGDPGKAPREMARRKKARRKDQVAHHGENEAQHAAMVADPVIGL